MHMLVLAAFVVSLVLTDPQVLPDLQPAGWYVLPAAGAYLLGSAAAGGVHVAVLLRYAGRDDGPSPGPRRLNALLGGFAAVWLVAGHGALLACGYARWIVEDLALGGSPLAPEALAAAPFAAALLISWVVQYPAHCRSRRAVGLHLDPAPAARACWSLGQYVGYNCRHYLLFVAVPIGVIVLGRGLLRLGLEPYLPPGRAGGYLLLAAVAGLALAVMFFAPLMIVRIWRTAPLPAGPLRDELEAMCRRLKLRYREILVWRTGGVIANAAVMGVAGPVRYILLSDGLLENLPPRSIESIFAHEAGHIASHHIFHAAIFTVSTVALGQVGVAAAAGMLGWSGSGVELAAMAAVVTIWATAFGWISRRFERQSDVIAAWLPGASDGDCITHEGAAAFAHALERVAALNGTPTRKRNWRHGSIADRVAYVLWLGGTGATRRGIDRVVERIKTVTWVLLFAAAAAVAAIELAAR